MNTIWNVWRSPFHMVNPIDPVQGPGQDSFKMRVNAVQPGVATPVAQPALVIEPELQTTAGQFPVDALRLSRDDRYYVETMNWILDKARVHYNNFRYVEADQTYALFFKYYNYYAKFHPSQTDLLPYFGAFFEYAYTKEILGKQKEAVTFINQQITKLMEAATQQATQVAQPVKTIIQELQAKNQLPTPTTLVNTQVMPETLVTLAQELVDRQQPVLARQFLGAATVLYTLALFQTERLAATLLPREASRTEAPPMLSLPFGFRHLGLPYAYFPLYDKNFGKMGEHASPVIPELELEVIGQVEALPKDPNSGDRQRRRQRRSQEVIKRRRTGKRITRPEGDILF